MRQKVAQKVGGRHWDVPLITAQKAGIELRNKVEFFSCAKGYDQLKFTTKIQMSFI